MLIQLICYIQTQIKVKQDSKRSGKKGDNLIPFPKAAEPLFSTVALPLWVANYYSQGDGWKTPGERHRQTLQDICNRVYGDSLTLQVTEDTEAWKKVSLIAIAIDLLIVFQGLYETMGLSQSNEGQGHAGCRRCVHRQVWCRFVTGCATEDRIWRMALFEKESGIPIQRDARNGTHVFLLFLTGKPLTKLLNGRAKRRVNSRAP